MFNRADNKIEGLQYNYLEMLKKFEMECDERNIFEFYD
jgi:hypothetical protein